MNLYHPNNPITGVSWVAMHMLAERTILEHLVQLGVLSGSIEDLEEARVRSCCQTCLRAHTYLLNAQQTTVGYGGSTIGYFLQFSVAQKNVHLFDNKSFMPAYIYVRSIIRGYTVKRVALEGLC